MDDVAVGVFYRHDGVRRGGERPVVIRRQVPGVTA